jgi:hypothetical protein
MHLDFSSLLIGLLIGIVLGIAVSAFLLGAHGDQGHQCP